MKNLFVFAALKRSSLLLDDVIKWLHKLDAHVRLKDALYVKARVCHALGVFPQRNKCALEFRDLDEQYPTWHKASVLAL